MNGQLRLCSGIVTMNDQCIIQSVDKATCAIFERPLASFLGQNIKILIPSPYREQHDSYVENYLRTGERHILGCSRLVEGITSGGVIFPLRLTVNEVFVDAQRIFIGVIDRVEDQACVLKATEDGTIVAVSSGIERILGYSPAELIGANVSKLMPEPFASHHDAYLMRWRQTRHAEREPGEPAVAYKVLNRVRNLPGRRKDGEVVPLSLRVTLVETEGHPWLQATLEATDGWMVLTVGCNGVIESVSQTNAQATAGRPAQELKGAHISSILLRPDGAHNDDERDYWQQSGTYNMQHSDGSVVLVDAQIYQFGADSYSVMLQRRKPDFSKLLNSSSSGSSGSSSSGSWSGYQTSASTSASSEYVTASTSSSAAGYEDFTPLSGGYVLGKKIGRGSNGCVRLAFHPLTNTSIAVKISSRSRGACASSSGDDDESAYRDRAMAELQTLKMLDHPYIAKCIDGFTTPTKSYLLMEFYRGGELGTFLKQFAPQPAPWPTVRRLFTQLISAVAYCHSHNIVHRDLSLQNILLDAKLDIRLVDFGLCAHIDNTTMRSTFCGTPKFAAPEMVLGKQYLGPSVDVWSLGVILYYMLSASFPFKTVLEIINCEYTILPTVPAEFVGLFRRIFVADPTARATTDHILYHPMLDAAILSESLPATVYRPDEWAARAQLEPPDDEPPFVTDDVHCQAPTSSSPLRSSDSDSASPQNYGGGCPFARVLSAKRDRANDVPAILPVDSEATKRQRT